MSEKNFSVEENTEESRKLTRVSLGVLAGAGIISALNGCTNVRSAEVFPIPEEVSSDGENQFFVIDDKTAPERSMIEEEEEILEDIKREITPLETAIQFVKDFDSLSYRGATLYWEKGDNPLPEERMKVFNQIIDSLNEVRDKFSVEENPFNIYVLEEEDYKTVCRADSPACVFHFKPLGIYPRVFLNKSKLDSVDDNVFSMFLIHEYVHTLQYAHEEELEEYASNVGWVKEWFSFVHPEENANFLKVITKSSLLNPHEDMAYTIMSSYICRNDMSTLSPERQEEVEKFWGDTQQDDYCQDFE